MPIHFVPDDEPPPAMPSSDEEQAGLDLVEVDPLAIVVSVELSSPDTLVGWRARHLSDWINFGYDLPYYTL